MRKASRAIAGPSPAQVEPDLKALSKMLQKNGVDKHARIQWPLARATLKNATGMPTLVGVAAATSAPPRPARNANLTEAASD